jgi:hypothetical protein|tara:strand:- start:259 stop:564 length:306 start_codon:yes stop_codon:yes gene_type:complete
MAANKMIGHNNPPKDRKINWKSISLNIWDHKSIVQCQEHIQSIREVYAALDGKKSKKLSIADTIGILTTNYFVDHICPAYDGTKNIYEQLLKQIKRERKQK